MFCADVPLEIKVGQAVEGGVDLVQLREKDLSPNELYYLATIIRYRIQDRALLFINNRIDVAIACGADGVQLGQSSLPTNIARDLVGSSMLLGKSVHNLEEALTAEQLGADFVILGSIHPTKSHPGYPGLGQSLIRDVAAQLELPILAIGGMNQHNAPEALEAGATGVACMGAILDTDNTLAAAQAIKKSLCQESAPHKRRAIDNQ